MEYKNIVTLCLIATGLLTNHIKLNASHFETDETRFKSLMKASKKQFNENDGINKPLSQDAAFLKQDIISYLENETAPFFDLEKMQHVYMPFFYIHLFSRTQISTFAKNTSLPTKKNFQFYSNLSEEFPGKTIKGYRISFSFVSETIFLGFYPAQLESDFEVHNIEQLFSYKHSLLSPKRALNPQAFSKALIDDTQVVMDCKGGTWLLCNTPSDLFMSSLLKKKSTLEFFDLLHLFPRMIGDIPGHTTRIINLNRTVSHSPQMVFQMQIGAKVKLLYHHRDPVGMLFSLNYQPTLDEKNLIYPDTFRKKLRSSQENNNFTDVVFFTEN